MNYENYLVIYIAEVIVILTTVVIAYCKMQHNNCKSAILQCVSKGHSALSRKIFIYQRLNK